jgi:hypothetical protein
MALSTIMQWRRHMNQGVTEALFAFALTRGIVLVIFILVGHLTLVSPEIGSGAGQTGPIFARNAVISLRDSPITQNLRQAVSQGDVNLYINLSERGYDQHAFGTSPEGSSQYAFFPLFPALLWLIDKVGLDKLWVATLLSNLFFSFALILLYKLARQLNYDNSSAGRAVFYLAAFPVSYFFSLPMPEALFLLLTVSSFYAAVNGKWLLAGGTGALASATRLNGVLLLPAVLILCWQRRETWSKRQILGLCLIPAGLLAYMLFSWERTGNSLAFADAGYLWGRHPTFFLNPLLTYFRKPYEIALPWNFILLNVAAALLAFACSYLLIKQRQWALAAYTLLTVLVPLSSSSVLSVARYMSVCFPIFIALSTAGRSSRIDQTIRAVFIALLGLMTALFAARFTMALT